MIETSSRTLSPRVWTWTSRAGWRHRDTPELVYEGMELTGTATG